MNLSEIADAFEFAAANPEHPDSARLIIAVGNLPLRITTVGNITTAELFGKLVAHRTVQPTITIEP